MDRLGFTEDEQTGRAPCRWIAVHHGPSGPAEGGNDHIHLAVNLVREDSSVAAPGRDWRVMSRVCADMERAFGLHVVAGRPGRGRPGYGRTQIERARRSGADLERLRERLEQTVRTTAAAAVSEAAFVHALTDAGAWVRPRYADAAHTHVSGYAVALAPAGGAKTDAVWFAAAPSPPT